MQETPIRIGPTRFEEDGATPVPSGSLEKKDEHRRI